MSKYIIVRMKGDRIKLTDGEYVRDLIMCRDCRWARPRTLPGETGYRCVFHRIWKGEDGYCDNGEREGE